MGSECVFSWEIFCLQEILPVRDFVSTLDEIDFPFFLLRKSLPALFVFGKISLLFQKQKEKQKKVSSHSDDDASSSSGLEGYISC